MERVLLLLLGLSIPFPLIGVPLNEQYTLPVAAAVGAAWAAVRTSREGLGGGHAWALALILTFAATAVFRHPISSIVLSLGALTLAILPLTVRPQSGEEGDSLLLGFKIGLTVTLVLEFLMIGLQVLPGRLPLEEIFGEHLTRPQGDFLGYNRPAAGFSEPSHLAIYLSACFALQDLLPLSPVARSWTKGLLALAVLLSGSLSGLAILFGYVAARAGVSLLKGSSLVPSVRSVLASLAGVSLIALVAVVFQDSLAEALGTYFERILMAQQDLAVDNLMSSEGSRLYAFLALFDFWSVSGLPGFLIGTGYGNYREFLAQMYGNLSEVTSFGRGDIDNMLVAVLLSTGVLGGIVYTAFTVRQFAGVAFAQKAPLLVLLLAINFSYGFLIAPLYWNLMLLLAVAASRAAAVSAPPAPTGVRA